MCFRPAPVQCTYPAVERMSVQCFAVLRSSYYCAMIRCIFLHSNCSIGIQYNYLGSIPCSFFLHNTENHKIFAKKRLFSLSRRVRSPASLPSATRLRPAPDTAKSSRIPVHGTDSAAPALSHSSAPAQPHQGQTVPSSDVQNT